GLCAELEDPMSKIFNQGIMTPLPPPWALAAIHAEGLETQCTGALPDGEQTPTGTAGFLNTVDLLDKISQLQAGMTSFSVPCKALNETMISTSRLTLPEESGRNFIFEADTPPPPHPVSRPAKVGQQLMVSSLGTVGHPFTCARPCRYVKRKGGCRDGANCPCCHECFWTKARGEEKAPNPSHMGPEVLPLSEGSQGHPNRCAGACKYVRRKGGCRDGAACPKCHFCQWRRDGLKNPPEQNGTQAFSVHAPGLLPSFGSEDCEEEHGTHASPLPLPLKLLSESQCAESLEMLPSIGSLGHPFTCAAPCRDHGDNNCQEGLQCTSCHRCCSSKMVLTSGQTFHL
ncbi:unnamed protein product, partial [Effrenium voratum]